LRRKSTIALLLARGLQLISSLKYPTALSWGWNRRAQPRGPGEATGVAGTAPAATNPGPRPPSFLVSRSRPGPTDPRPGFADLVAKTSCFPGAPGAGLPYRPPRGGLFSLAAA
jgi:hypothetical protein